MSTTVDRASLLSALRALRPLATNTQIPVLANIAITSDEGSLELVATNLDQFGKRVVAFEGEPLDVTVPAKALSDFAGAMSADTLTMELDEKKSKLKIKAGRQQATLATITRDEFPPFPSLGEESHSFTVTRDEFDANIRRVIGFAATDQARPILTGVAVQGNGERIQFVAADNYRIGVATVDHPAKLEAVVPAVAFSHAAKVLEGDHVSITVDTGRMAMLSSDHGVLVTRLIEGTYPNISPVLPTSSKATMLVDQAELEQTMKLASIASSLVVKFDEVEGGLRVHAEEHDRAFDTTMEATFGADKEGEVLFALSEKYMSAIAAVFGESSTVEIGWTTPLQPVAFRDPDDPTFRAVIMPVRVER